MTKKPPVSYMMVSTLPKDRKNIEQKRKRANLNSDIYKSVCSDIVDKRYAEIALLLAYYDIGQCPYCLKSNSMVFGKYKEKTLICRSCLYPLKLTALPIRDPLKLARFLLYFHKSKNTSTVDMAKLFNMQLNTAIRCIMWSFSKHNTYANRILRKRSSLNFFLSEACQVTSDIQKTHFRLKHITNTKITSLRN